MDRQRLRSWLDQTHKTWRWNDGDNERYSGVSTTDDGLRWFRWSHVFGEESGDHDVEIQPFDDFRTAGPRRALPDDVLEQLRAWLDKRG